MTEKRFQIIDDNLFDNKNMEVLMVDFEVDGVPRIVDVLNELNDENEQLKEELKTKVVVNRQYEELQKLKKENEQLKKQIERIDFILDDLNGAEYISRDDGIKALNKIDKVIGKR